MMRCQVIGDEELIARFEAALGRMKSLKPYYLNDAAEIVHDAIRENILAQGLVSGPEEAHDPRKRGHLADSGRIFYRTANGVSVGYGKDIDYAAALEFGAGPHWIIARELGNDLTFYWEKTGEWFVGPAVHHPGNKPYRYVYHGTEEAWYPVCLMMLDYVEASFGVSHL